jgi:redox-sensitive bicupin YhaK (pirin superfamily)
MTAISTAPILSGAAQKSERSVYKIISPSNANMGRMALKKVIQGNYQNYVSPFFVFDEFGPMHLQKGTPFRVDAHPHAGIIPTTYLFSGGAHHRDSMNNDFQYQAGDFIQFTSGKGALHMEETGDELFANGGTFHGIQSWLNIPGRLKNAEPNASHIQKRDIAVLEKENATIRVILGEVYGVTSKMQLLMPVIYWHISLKENTTLELPIDFTQNVFVYLLNGQLEIGNQVVDPSQAVLYERDGDIIKIKARQTSDFLVLGGEVNNEPYAADGPFVLNNEKELNQAYINFQQGKFGDLVKTNGKRR